MKAIILAAGEGKRLRPLTNDNPKCLVKLFGKSLLQHQVDIFTKHGIDDIIVVTGYKHEKLKLKNIKYYHNYDYVSTNMVETLFCAKNELNQSTIISYGDIIFDDRVLEKLLSSRSECSIIVDRNWKNYWKLRFTDPLSDAESLSLNKYNYIVDIGQKVDSIDSIHGQFIGLMKFQRNGIKKLYSYYLEAKRKSKTHNILNSNLQFKQSYMTDLLRGMIKKNIALKAVFITGGWLELDSLDDYSLYTKMYNDRTLSKLIRL